MERETASLQTIFLLVLFAEAIVELWKNAAPLHRIKTFLVAATPFLYSQTRQTHLLLCPYCLSVYAGIVSGCLFLLWEHALVRFIVYALTIHRMANFVHLIFSYLKDRQMDVRVNRGKQYGTMRDKEG